MMYVISRGCFNDICGYYDSNYASALGTISQFWAGIYDWKDDIKHVFICCFFYIVIWWRS